MSRYIQPLYGLRKVFEWTNQTLTDVFGEKPEVRGSGVSEVASTVKNGDDKRTHQNQLRWMMSEDRWRTTYQKRQHMKLKWWLRLLGFGPYHRRLIEENYLLRQELVDKQEHLDEAGRIGRELFAYREYAEFAVRFKPEYVYEFSYVREKPGLLAEIKELRRKLDRVSQAHRELYDAWREQHLSCPGYVAPPPPEKDPEADG